MGVQSRLNTGEAQELEGLMKEYPNWSNDYPDIYGTINPKIYHKHRSRDDKSAKAVHKRNGPTPKTDYQITYQRHNLRPRSSKRPPPSPRDQHPPSMTFNTIQRSDFIPNEVMTRTDPYVPKENYEPSKDKFHVMSKYAEDFPPKYQPLPEIRAKALEGQIKRSESKFDGRTTYKEEHKQYQPNPSLSFGDLPSFADSILYPGKLHHQQPETTTRSTFKGKPGKRADIFDAIEPNIKLEGEHDLTTVNGLTYKAHEGARPAQKIENRPQLAETKRGKFEAETQAQRDFGYKEIEPTRPMPPAPETIDLRFDNQVSFDTEQRHQFKGIDASKHPAPKSFKKEVDRYERPTVKMESQSHQQLTFQPIDIASAYVPPVKRNEVSKISDGKGKFSAKTTSKEFFKPWEVQARVRHGDVNEGYTYIPPQDYFDPKTTTGDTFGPKSVAIPEPFKPEQNSIEKNGSHDFNTIYRVEFNKQQIGMLNRLPPNEAKFLLGELRKKKHMQAAV